MNPSKALLNRLTHPMPRRPYMTIIMLLSTPSPKNEKSTEKILPLVPRLKKRPRRYNVIVKHKRECSFKMYMLHAGINPVIIEIINPVIWGNQGYLRG